MNYTVEKLEKSQVKFNYVVDKDKFNAAIKQAYEKTKHKYAVPGFRKGHAPQRVIEGMYGQGVFFSDAVNELIDSSLEELEKDEKLRFRGCRQRMRRRYDRRRRCEILNRHGRQTRSRSRTI